MSQLQPLSSMPIDWKRWHEKLCHLLIIDPTQSLSVQPLPTPWFLIPTRRELSREEAKDLIFTIRHYLYASERITTRRVRDRLRRLHPDSTLPFLYGMRYVAFRDAGQHYYWPAFRKTFLDNLLSYDEVAIGLASSTSTLWLRLYEWTAGALYYPREGPTHIKWPLAHAGLLEDDKEVLGEFGRHLLKSHDLYKSLITLEVEEFIILFKDWLTQNPTFTHTRLGRLITTRSQAKEIVAELGQKWLQLNQDRVRLTASSDTDSTSTFPSIRRHIVYQADTNQIAFEFIPGPIEGEASLTLDWRGRPIAFPSHYSELSDRTFPLKVSITLEEPAQNPTAIVSVKREQESEKRELSLPILPNDKGIVFDHTTGEQTKRWEPGQSYYVLIPKDRVKSSKAKLFEDWLDLGTAHGEWQDYRLLWVKTKDPFAELRSHRGTEMIDSLAALEQAAEDMGLPGFGHQYRVHARLFGEVVASDGNRRNPVFAADRPPYVEIRGVWREDLSIELFRQNEQSAQFETMSRLVVPKTLSTESQVIEIWKNQAETAIYRVKVGSEELNFTIYDWEQINNRHNLPTFQIVTWFENELGQRIYRPTRYELDNLIFCVEAWPHAGLILEIHGVSIHNPYRLSIQTDVTGKWKEEINNLPADLSTVRGALTFKVSWRGLFHRELTIRDKGWVATDSIKTAIVPKITDGQLTFICTGNIKGGMGKDSYHGLLLPSLPWEADPLIFPLNFTSDGYFRGVSKLNWTPQWLLIGLQSFDDNSELEIVSVQKLKAEESFSKLQTYNLGQLVASYSPSWSLLAKKISEITHPLSIEVFILVDPILSFLKKTSALELQPKWKFFSKWEELTKVIRLMSHGFKGTLFEKLVRSNELPQPVISINFHESRSSSQAGQLDFWYTNSQIRGKLVRTRQGRLGVEIRQTLWVCSKCNLMLPKPLFDGHAAPFAGAVDCTGTGMAFTEYREGHNRKLSVYVGVLVEPKTIFRSVLAQLEKVLWGNTDFNSDTANWLRHLRSLVPQEVDPGDWLRGLCQAIRELENLLGQPDVTLLQLAVAGAKLARYEDGLRLVLDRIRELST